MQNGERNITDGRGIVFNYVADGGEGKSVFRLSGEEVSSAIKTSPGCFLLFRHKLAELGIQSWNCSWDRPEQWPTTCKHTRNRCSCVRTGRRWYLPHFVRSSNTDRLLRREEQTGHSPSSAASTPGEKTASIPGKMKLRVGT